MIPKAAGWSALLAIALPAFAASAEDLATFLASSQFAIIRSPDRVESLPVESLADPAKDWSSGMKTSLPGSFRIIDEPIPVPKELAAPLATLILNPASYESVYKLCIFEPGVAFRFWKGKEALDVFLCFHCGDLGFQRVGATTALGGKLSFDPVRSRLVGIVQAARPKDARFRDLK